MRRPGVRGDFWPTPSEEAILRASLQQPAEAVRAWKAVGPSLDIDTMPWETVRVLPLVYRNLSQAGAEDDELPRLRGLYRRAWYHNNLQLGSLAEVLRLLRAEGIDTLVLKGVDLALRYYRDTGLRPMSDVDIMVPPECARDAMRLLEASGWERPGFTDEELLARAHGIGYRGAQGRRVDLHWHLGNHLLVPGNLRGSADALWERSIEVEIAGEPTRVLDPAHLLLHVVVHGAGSNDGTTVQWVADAVTILRVAPDLDWDLMVDDAVRRRAVLPVRDGLDYVATTLSVPIPSEVVGRLRSATTSRRDAFAHWATVRHRARPLGGFLSNLAVHVRLTSDRSTVRMLAGIPVYLKETWGLNNLWQLPATAIRRLGGKVRRRGGTGGGPQVSVGRGRVAEPVGQAPDVLLQRHAAGELPPEPPHPIGGLNG